MKDSVNNELEEGDLVAYILTTYGTQRAIAIGIILSFTPQKIKIAQIPTKLVDDNGVNDVPRTTLIDALRKEDVSLYYPRHVIKLNKIYDYQK